MTIRWGHAMFNKTGSARYTATKFAANILYWYVIGSLCSKSGEIGLFSKSHN